MFKVEAKALLEGLLFAWAKGYGKNITKCDNFLLVDLLSLGGGVDSNLVEIRMLHQIIHHQWKVCVRYILRSINRIADKMVKLSNSSSHLLRIFRSPPTLILRLLAENNRVCFG